MHRGRLCFTYESASCRAFRLGRADNVHPATKARGENKQEQTVFNEDLDIFEDYLMQFCTVFLIPRNVLSLNWRAQFWRRWRYLKFSTNNPEVAINSK